MLDIEFSRTDILVGPFNSIRECGQAGMPVLPNKKGQGQSLTFRFAFGKDFSRSALHGLLAFAQKFERLLHLKVLD